MVGIGVAVALLGMLVVGAAVSVAQDNRARRRRDEPGRAAAFRRILFTQLPDAGTAEDPPGSDHAERWSSFGIGQQVRIVPPEELRPAADANAATPDVIELPHGSPVPQQPVPQQPQPAQVPRQRLGRQESPAAEPCRSSLPPV